MILTYEERTAVQRLSALYDEIDLLRDEAADTIAEITGLSG